MPVSNPTLANYVFLQPMREDRYFPTPLVEKGARILIDLCLAIEETKPKDAAALLVLTHAATERFNELAVEFEEAGSEIETAAREAIGGDVEAIVKVYGFDVDIEDAIAPRDW